MGILTILLNFPKEEAPLQTTHCGLLLIQPFGLPGSEVADALVRRRRPRFPLPHPGRPPTSPAPSDELQLLFAPSAFNLLLMPCGLLWGQGTLGVE